MEKLKGERNACGKALVNMQRTLAENARHVDQVCVCVDSDVITEPAKKHHSLLSAPCPYPWDFFLAA